MQFTPDAPLDALLEVEPGQRHAPVDTIKQNRPLLMLCLSSLMFLVGLFTLQTVGIFYARDVLGNATTTSSRR